MNDPHAHIVRPSQRPMVLAAAFAAVAALAGCADNAKKMAEEEAAKNTIACQLNGERVVIRFDAGEARLLIAGADRVTLYQIASASGIRYSNGSMELRGKGTALELSRYGTATSLADCQPYVVPK